MANILRSELAVVQTKEIHVCSYRIHDPNVGTQEVEVNMNTRAVPLYIKVKPAS